MRGMCSSPCFGAFAILLWASTAAASDDVSQTVGHGQINYSDQTITVTGSGAPSLNAANVAVARLGAERAAKLDAMRNVLEAVKGVRLSGQKTAAQAIDASPEMKAKVDGVVRNFKVTDTKYYSDGGVDVIVSVPLKDVLDVLLPTAGSTSASALAPAPEADPSGVVVNAKGLNVLPALAPRLLDEAGKELFSAAAVTKDALKRHGVAVYSRSLDKALKNDRVGAKPWVIKAQKVAADQADLVIAAADASKLSQLAAILADGRLVIVTD